jgi:hypothetical protein
MKMMHGEFCLACSKRSRTREAPTPTNISTKSEPEIEKNGTPASPATVEQDALGDAGPERLELLRVLQELLDLVELLDGLVDARDVTERDLRRVDRHPLGAGLAERHDLRAAALDLVHQEDPERDEDHERQDVGEQPQPGARLARLDVVVLDQPLLLGRLQPRVEAIGRVVGEPRLVLLVARLEGDRDDVVLRAQVDLLDLTRVELRDEVAVGRRRLGVAGRDQLVGEEGQQDHDQDRERGTLEEAAHERWCAEGFRVGRKGVEGIRGGETALTVLRSPSAADARPVAAPSQLSVVNAATYGRLR